MMNSTWFVSFLAVLLLVMRPAAATTMNPNTDWFRDAGYGVFMHVLPSDDRQLGQLADFDVEHLARQLEQAGARYFCITLGQNSGYFIAPNATYDRVTGYRAGERCAARDLPLALYQALDAKGIRLMLYLPCQAPNRDARAQKAFGLPEGPADQPIDLAFAQRWAEVIREWSDRYGDKVAGWWFDGGYQHIRFAEPIAAVYAAAAKHGNPKSLVTFNPGVSLIRHTEAEDYTAGELNEPFKYLPESRWVKGSQWHALTFLGANWGGREPRFTAKEWADWTKAVLAKEGVVTFDVGPNWNPAEGPVGSIASAQVEVLKTIRDVVRGSSKALSGQRLKRSESYFGLHFDFHAGDDCNEIGKNTTREMVERIIDAARPDYIQVDSKGHRGLTSYPTKVGNPAPGFVGDQLKIWRQVTAERGVALYAHHSGVWDSEAIVRHPDWAVINANGKTNENATSFFGPYVDQLLIPQLREMAGDYGLDGAWVDGECWASQPDFGSAASKAFAAATGFQEVPRKPGEPHWFEFLEFNRNAFRAYLRHYLGAVRSTHPSFQLCSNWAFSDHMPEVVSADVDWISGDFSPEDAVNSARFSARYLVYQGKPWDLMAWSFVTKGIRPNGDRQKSAVQLQREAAIVLSQGGGFQMYHTQRRDGSVPMEYLPAIREVAKFCRERQPFCQGAVPVPQVAFLYSTYAHYREINSLFGRDLADLQGSLQALIEGGQVLDLVSEHSLTGRMKEYPVIVVGEGKTLDPGFRRELLDYAAGGGRLLLLGPDAASLFAADLKLSLGDSSQEARSLAWQGQRFQTAGAVRSVRVPAGGRAVGTLEGKADKNLEATPAAVVVPHGKGEVAATLFAFSRGYLAARTPVMRDYLNAIVRELFPNPVVRITRGTDVDLSVNRVKGRFTVHLVNASGAHWDQKTTLIESLPAIGPIDLEIRRDQRPGAVRLEPGGTALPFEYRDGVVRTTVPRVEVHSMVTVE
ncbi:MAG: alpha-L-fucosidase [Verrucomicrobiales bacterium]|nr:alpha-L-fucosidase [Verrucomicrobiales bacterium]